MGAVCPAPLPRQRDPFCICHSQPSHFLTNPGRGRQALDAFFAHLFIHLLTITLVGCPRYAPCMRQMLLPGKWRFFSPRISLPPGVVTHFSSTKKTQCDGSAPCTRCSRLGLQCVLMRPAGRRGRPKKSLIRLAARASLPRIHSPDSERSPTSGVRNDPSPAGETSLRGDATCNPVAPRESNSESQSSSPPGEFVAINDSNVEIDDAAPLAFDNVDSPGYEGAWLAATYLCQVSSRNFWAAGPGRDSSGLPTDTLPSLSFTPAAPSGENTSLLRPINALASIDLDEASAYNILQLLLKPDATRGPSGIFDDLQLDASVAMRCLYGDADAPCPLELSLALLAMGIEFHASSLSPELQANKDIIVDTLRIEFLKRIPVLTWKSTDINCYQALALSLASLTWCLNDHLGDVAVRWNGMAQLLLDTLPNAPGSMSEPSGLYDWYVPSAARLQSLPYKF